MLAHSVMGAYKKGERLERAFTRIRKEKKAMARCEPQDEQYEENPELTAITERLREAKERAEKADDEYQERHRHWIENPCRVTQQQMLVARKAKGDAFVLLEEERLEADDELGWWGMR